MTYDEQLVNLRNCNSSIKAISDAVGKSERTVSRDLRRLGLTCGDSRPDIPDDEVLAMWRSGKAPKEIAAHFGCAVSTVEGRLLRMDVGFVKGKRKYVRKRDDSKAKQAMFLEKARAVHGDVYDYSRVEYVNSKSKVRILCPLHGEFLQSPEKHWVGQGCPSCSQDRLEETNRKRYGVSRPLQSKEIHEAMEETNLRVRGVRNPAQDLAVQERMKVTCQAVYGVDYSCESESVKAKRIATNERKYGGPSPFCDQGVRDRAIASTVSHFGVDNALKHPDVQAKRRATCLERFGFEEPLSAPLVQERKNATMVANYGGKCPFVSKAVRDKSIATLMRTRGVDNPMKVSEVKEKVVESKRVNGTFGKFKPEDYIYKRLVGVFGEDDVVRQYRSVEYPYACDFYVRSRDMYIEYNGYFTHGGHWFREGNVDDYAILREWELRSVEHPHYGTAVPIWTKSDVAKREAARSHDLNYVTFWCPSCMVDADKSEEGVIVLYDADLWFLMGCPDGRDWEVEYSWLPARDFAPVRPSRFKGTARDIKAWVKYYQYSEFYKAELGMVSENSTVHGMPLLFYLYWNRYEYKGKLPFDLTDDQILQALCVSGVHRSYTRYDVGLMDKVVKAYGIKSIYDPCAGWGERMLYCHANGIRYLGCDVNRGFVSGYEAMTKEFCMSEQSFLICDGAEGMLGWSADAVVTCPPYGNIEVYSEWGSENLSEAGFLAWWDTVVRRCTKFRLFCFQVNTKWRDRMAVIVEENGFRLLDEFFWERECVSHFNREADGTVTKKSRESMLVFERRFG